MTTPGDEALADWSLLQSVMTRLTVAETMTATLQALLLPAPSPDEAEVCLWTIDSDVHGALGWLSNVGSLPAAGQPARSRPGERHNLADFPSARTYLATPGVPLLVHSIATDPDLDPGVRATWQAQGVQATIVVALALRGRVVGMLTVYWPRELALGPRERRIYQALAPHAALLLDNLVMVERLRASLAATQQQQRLLETVVDHVPVGILCIEPGTRRPIVTNRMARMMLVGDPEPVSTPLPITYMLLPGTDITVAESELAGMRAARTGLPQRVDLDLVPPGSPRISVETLGAPVRDADGNIDRVVVVMTDITGRKREAEERARLQEEVIRAQAIALAERSTPLIPISDDVLVMPLIGTIDRERGQALLEAALHGARERRARVTILDITGVLSLDSEAVESLTRTANALRLLGVTPMLTGVRPQVANTLTELGASLTGIATHGSLQAAIELALRRPGKRS